MSDTRMRPNLASLAALNLAAKPDLAATTDLTDAADATPSQGVFVSYPGSPFQLFQPYPPAGDQPAAINQLVEGLEDGLAYQTLLGVTGSGKTFTMANVIARMGRPAIVFAPNKTLAAQLYAEFREFFPKNAVEYFVSYYDYYQPEAYVPQRDMFIEKDSAINEHIEQMRLSATKSVLERRDTVIVASVSAIYGIGKPEDYSQMRFIVRVGDKIDQRDIIAQLIRMQYSRNDVDFARGSFRVRGDTIDVFPAEHSELAVRLELFDDEVEALSLLDPLTGRVRQKVPRAKSTSLRLYCMRISWAMMSRWSILSPTRTMWTLRAAPSGCAATRSTCFRPSILSWRCASSCSTTRSRG